MSERSGRPIESETTASDHPTDPSTDASAQVTGTPTEVAEPIEAARPIETAQPIEVGDGPFSLTGEDEEPAPPKPRSRTRTIVLAGLLAAGVAGAGVLGVTGWRVISQKDATLTAPTELTSLRIDDSEDGRATADYLTNALSAEIDFDHTVGAVYRDTTDPAKGVLFFGGTTLIWSPTTDLGSAFNLIADDQGSVTDVHDVDAGSLGGTMQCGTTASADGDISVCGWADHGSIAVALFPGRTEDESATLMRAFRDAAQKRG